MPPSWGENRFVLRLPHGRRRQQSRLCFGLANCLWLRERSFEGNSPSRGSSGKDDSLRAPEGLGQETPAILRGTPELSNSAPDSSGDDKSDAQKGKARYSKPSQRVGSTYYALSECTSQGSLAQNAFPGPERKDSPYSKSQTKAPQNPIPPMFQGGQSPPPCHPDQRAQSNGHYD